jgi:hypothetical protein
MSGMFTVMLGLVMVVASPVSTMGSFYLLPSPVLAAADEGGSNGGGGSENSGSGDNSNGGSNDNEGSVKDEGKTENENTPPSNEGSGDKTTSAEQSGATSKLPKCDGSFQDCVTHNGDVCKAGQGGHECECADDMSDCPKNPAIQPDCKTKPNDPACMVHCDALGCPGSPPMPAEPKTKTGPDNSCLFHPEQEKCKSDNGKCPDGFFQNEDANCVPNHKQCPKGFHSHENDETGRCIPDSTPCEPGFIRDPDFPTCSSKESVCRDHPELRVCGGKGDGGHDNHGGTVKVVVNIKNIIHKSSSSQSSSSLSQACFDVLKIVWLNKVQLGQDKEVDNFINKCLAINT